EFTVSYKIGSDEEGNSLYLYGAGDESGKLNINKIDKELLAELPGFSVELASAVLDWCDEDSLARADGAEDDYYKGLENPYECRNAAFSVPEELMLVRGVTKEIYDKVKGIITVYGESAAVNINTSPAEVLAVLVGVEFEELPAKIVNYRNGHDELPGTEDDRVFTDTKTIVVQLSGSLTGGPNLLEQKRLNELISDKKCFKVYSNIFRIVSRGEVKNGRIKKMIEAVIKRTDGEDSEFLYYHEG
ncbi:MAG: type II secretion system protein GspK, partial [Candidatus Omnitrophota bacterium]|nr:type II secretion system protein GspK [Candidatus Omnitrophota bacterium]